MEERNEPVGVMTVSVRDFENARTFMEDWTDYLEDEEGFDFDSDDDAEVEIWTDERESLAFALTKEVLLVVFADDPENTLEDMLDLITGRSDRSLADTEQFQAARQQYSDRRFASVFLDIEELLDLLEDADLISDEAYDFAAVSDSSDFPNWAAATAQWIDRGIVVEILAPNTIDITSNLQGLDNPAELVHAETIGLFAATFDTDLDNWREHLEDYGSDDEISYYVEDIYVELYREVEWQSDSPPRFKENPDMADVLDIFIELVEAYSDVELEKDFIDNLGGKFILAVEEFDAGRIEEDPMEETLNVVAMLSYLPESESRLEDSLEDFSDFLQEEIPLDIDSEDVGADNDAEIFRPDFFGIETDYTPGYVLHNGYLVFGTTEEALENVVSAQNGDEDALSSVTEYQRAVEVLPGEPQFLFWLDLRSIVAQLDADDMDMTDDEFEALEESIGSLVVVSSVDEEMIRASLAVTFFPQ